MRKFDQASAIAALELQQLVAEWTHELDANGGIKIAELCTSDCNYVIGATAYRGHAAVTDFYVARGERVRTQQRDGVRTQRHTVSGVRIALRDPSHAQVEFLVVNYSAEGKAPAMNLVGPTIIADAQMKCAREADGLWRIAEFTSQPVFIGNDPFLNASVVKK
jgi:hypothetical protein